jgi:glycosyltransferase involved in cell wall biosynthesis
MRILVVLTYYRPHISGLTIYAERLARAWVRRGHQVTVLTSQYLPNLPGEETMDGVRIVRVPVLFRLSKGVIMPTFGALASKLVVENDVIQLHLPQFDAAGVALRGRLLNKPTVITYHCDLRMPSGLVSWAANMAVKVMNNLAALSTHRIVTYTQDYAVHSNYLKRYLGKLHVIPPPVELPEISAADVQEFRQRHNPDNRGPIIGMMARFATEKGVEILMRALPRILEAHPQALVWFGGPYKNILGEEQYWARLAPELERLQKAGSWRFLGALDPRQAAAFFASIDLHVLPSLNSTEAFGLVQIESMLNGVPCVTSNLPGVRIPVQRHEMGRIFEIGDAAGLAEAALEVLANPEKFKRPVGPIAELYSPDAIAVEYEKLFAQMRGEVLVEG